MTRRSTFLGSLTALALLLALAAAPAAYACFCNCEYSADCKEGEYCQYTGNNCIETTSPGGLPWDGLCKKRAGSVDQDRQAVAAQALGLWLQAFRDAGAEYGGEPDPATLAGLEALPLNAQQRDDIRTLALSILGLTVGYTAFPDATHSQPGFFSPPLLVEDNSPQPCSNAPDQIDHGVVAPLDTTLLAALDRVREGVVAELANPGLGALDEALDRIKTAHPEYETVAQCEASRNADGFPYADGFACLRVELSLRVHSLLTHPPTAEGPWGVRHAALNR